MSRQLGFLPDAETDLHAYTCNVPGAPKFRNGPAEPDTQEEVSILKRPGRVSACRMLMFPTWEWQLQSISLHPLYVRMFPAACCMPRLLPPLRICKHLLGKVQPCHLFSNETASLQAMCACCDCIVPCVLMVYRICFMRSSGRVRSSCLHRMYSGTLYARLV